MISEFLDTLEFSLSVTGPIFVILGLGAWLRRIGMINDAFIEVGSRLVFNVTLPALLFISVSKTHLDTSANFALIGFGIAATLLAWGASELMARVAVRAARDRGVVVQGVFRSNMAIIGLAYCVNAYGEPGMAAASLYVGLVTIAFNILSVISLSASLHASQDVTTAGASVMQSAQFDDFDDLPQQDGQGCLHGFPDHIEIDVKVTVGHAITHTAHLLPGQGGMR